jgi:membrane protease subunit HflK
MEVHLPNEGMPKLPPIKWAAWLVPILIILIALIGLGSMFYQVGPDEMGVVQRFGKYVRTTNPGLHMRLPFGIETVRRIKVTHVFKEEFGFRTAIPGVRTVFEGREDTLRERTGGIRSVTQDPFLDESLMLTGDLNVAVVEWIVQYRVKDPVQYAFRIRDPRETLRNMSEAMMRLVVGDHTINEVLTSGREEIQMQAEQKLQEVLDSYQSGIQILNVILQDVTPPNEVKPSFNEVNEARQEKERLINQARQEYNRVIPKAKGEAEQQIREAEGYALDRINRAKGDAERFDVTLKAYLQAPEVTKKRLYLETMDKVLPDFQEKIIIDESQKGIVPLLQLSQEKGGQE